ncbi:LacI family transcriptional regulator [Streptomyces sp. NBC_01317]|uniref:LacI family DNA-binding transcriptional regulator n=1 Tax=Streptomyces sp. NBC_01317 TaxID=2903822 RepID=UPI002E0EF738|nr:LacI family transcriptional regulator [Streptomyces sp. NBC_01317]
MTEDVRSAAAPTLEDVARAAGVSRATVSRVVNGVRNVDPAIQEAVRQAVAATGYTPNRAARSLVTRRADAIALVVSGAAADDAIDETGPPSSERDDGGADGEDGETDGGSVSFTARVSADPFFGRVVTGVVNHLRPRGMYPMLMFAGTARARDEVVSYIRQGNTDGALVVSAHAEDPLPSLLTEAGLSAVLYGRPTRPVRISYVDLAQREGARLAAERLLERGCRRIVTITGPLEAPVGQDRLTGFRETLARRGRPEVPAVEGRFSQESGEVAMARLLAEHPDLDGVFAANDLMAVGACHVLREHGRRVPEDVAVIGFDDNGVAAACRPPLTTVRQPVEEMAAAMVDLLLDRLARPTLPVTSVIYEPTLVVRDSA